MANAVFRFNCYAIRHGDVLPIPTYVRHGKIVVPVGAGGNAVYQDHDMAFDARQFLPGDIVGIKYWRAADEPEDDYAGDLKIINFASYIGAPADSVTMFNSFMDDESDQVPVFSMQE